MSLGPLPAARSRPLMTSTPQAVGRRKPPTAADQCGGGAARLRMARTARNPLSHTHAHTSTFSASWVTHPCTYGRNVEPQG